MNTKEKLMEVWKEVLRTDDVSSESNIMDMGGDSYTIFKLTNLSKEKFGLQFTPMDVMMYPKIDSLADFIDNGATVGADEVENTVRPVRRRKAKS